MRLIRTNATRILSTFLAAVFFAANVVYAHSYESNFWKERKRAQPQLASLPSSPLPSNPSQILRQLPQPQPSLSQVSSKLKRLLPKQNAIELAALVAGIPAQFGTVKNISVPTEKSGKTVIHIQDVHMNQEAQKNIGRTIQALIDQKKIELVGLEGAFDSIDLSDFRSLPNQTPVHKVADYLLRENKISGPVHTAFKSQTEIPPFVGVDHPAHYKANVEAYKESSAFSVQSAARLEKLLGVLGQKKKTVFNAVLKAFDEKVESYRRGDIKLGAYVQFLSQKLEGNADRTSIEIYLSALDLENSLDFKRVEVQRTILIKNLLDTLGKTQMKGLLNTSVAFRMGAVPHTDFYEYLKGLCEENGVSLSRYPAMRDYIQYVLLSDLIEVETLFKEVQKMEKEIYRSLTENDQEKALIEESKYLSLVGKLIEFSLTADEWQSYKELKNFSSPFKGRSALADPSFGGLGGDINFPFQFQQKVTTEPFESFYFEAEARDEAMAKNLLRAMKENSAGVAVLVSGGFHSKGISHLLSKAGVTTITVTPKITKIEDETGSGYLSVFTREKTPLDKLFDGEKLFLAQKAVPNLMPVVMMIRATNKYLERGFIKTVQAKVRSGRYVMRVVFNLKEDIVLASLTLVGSHLSLLYLVHLSLLHPALGLGLLIVLDAAFLFSYREQIQGLLQRFFDSPFLVQLVEGGTLLATSIPDDEANLGNSVPPDSAGWEVVDPFSKYRDMVGHKVKITDNQNKEYVSKVLDFKKEPIPHFIFQEGPFPIEEIKMIEILDLEKGPQSWERLHKITFYKRRGARGGRAISMMVSALGATVIFVGLSMATLLSGLVGSVNKASAALYKTEPVLLKKFVDPTKEKKPKNDPLVVPLYFYELGGKSWVLPRYIDLKKHEEAVKKATEIWNERKPKYLKDWFDWTYQENKEFPSLNETDSKIRFIAAYVVYHLDWYEFDRMMDAWGVPLDLRFFLYRRFADVNALPVFLNGEEAFMTRVEGTTKEINETIDKKADEFSLNRVLNDETSSQADLIEAFDEYGPRLRFGVKGDVKNLRKILIALRDVLDKNPDILNFRLPLGVGIQVDLSLPWSRTMTDKDNVERGKKIPGTIDFDGVYVKFNETTSFPKAFEQAVRLSRLVGHSGRVQGLDYEFSQLRFNPLLNRLKGDVRNKFEAKAQELRKKLSALLEEGKPWTKGEKTPPKKELEEFEKRLSEIEKAWIIFNQHLQKEPIQKTKGKNKRSSLRSLSIDPIGGAIFLGLISLFFNAAKDFFAANPITGLLAQAGEAVKNVDIQPVPEGLPDWLQIVIIGVVLFTLLASWDRRSSHKKEKKDSSSDRQEGATTPITAFTWMMAVVVLGIIVFLLNIEDEGRLEVTPPWLGFLPGDFSTWVHGTVIVLLLLLVWLVYFLFSFFQQKTPHELIEKKSIPTKIRRILNSIWAFWRQLWNDKRGTLNPSFSLNQTPNPPDPIHLLTNLILKKKKKKKREAWEEKLKLFPENEINTISELLDRTVEDLSAMGFSEDEIKDIKDAISSIPGLFLKPSNDPQSQPIEEFIASLSQGRPMHTLTKFAQDREITNSAGLEMITRDEILSVEDLGLQTVEKVETGLEKKGLRLKQVPDSIMWIVRLTDVDDLDQNYLEPKLAEGGISTITQLQSLDLAALENLFGKGHQYKVAHQKFFRAARDNGILFADQLPEESKSLKAFLADEDGGILPDHPLTWGVVVLSLVVIVFILKIMGNGSPGFSLGDLPTWVVWAVLGVLFLLAVILLSVVLLQRKTINKLKKNQMGNIKRTVHEESHSGSSQAGDGFMEQLGIDMELATWILQSNIKDFGFKPETLKALNLHGHERVETLVAEAEEGISMRSQMDAASLADIKSTLEKWGLRLGMSFEEIQLWVPDRKLFLTNEIGFFHLKLFWIVSTSIDKHPNYDTIWNLVQKPEEELTGLTFNMKQMLKVRLSDIGLRFGMTEEGLETWVYQSSKKSRIRSVDLKDENGPVRSAGRIRRFLSDVKDLFLEFVDDDRGTLDPSMSLRQAPNPPDPIDLLTKVILRNPEEPEAWEGILEHFRTVGINTISKLLETTEEELRSMNFSEYQIKVIKRELSRVNGLRLKPDKNPQSQPIMEFMDSLKIRPQTWVAFKKFVSFKEISKSAQLENITRDEILLVMKLDPSSVNKVEEQLEDQGHRLKQVPDTIMWIVRLTKVNSNVQGRLKNLLARGGIITITEVRKLTEGELIQSLKKTFSKGFLGWSNALGDKNIDKFLKALRENEILLTDQHPEKPITETKNSRGKTLTSFLLPFIQSSLVFFGSVAAAMAQSHNSLPSDPKPADDSKVVRSHQEVQSGIIYELNLQKDAEAVYAFIKGAVTGQGVTLEQIEALFAGTEDRLEIGEVKKLSAVGKLAHLSPEQIEKEFQIVRQKFEEEKPGITISEEDARLLAAVLMAEDLGSTIEGLLMVPFEGGDEAQIEEDLSNAFRLIQRGQHLLIMIPERNKAAFKAGLAALSLPIGSNVSIGAVKGGFIFQGRHGSELNVWTTGRFLSRHRHLQNGTLAFSPELYIDVKAFEEFPVLNRLKLAFLTVLLGIISIASGKIRRVQEIKTYIQYAIAA